MRHRITLIPGDGVGPEVMLAATRSIEATGVEIEWEQVQAGQGAIDKFGTPLPETVLESIRKNKVAIKGPITTPVGSGFRSVNVELRKTLDLYACIRPCKFYEGVRSKYKDVDIVIVRENTEDLYAGIEFPEGTKDTGEIIKLVETLCKITPVRNTRLSQKNKISNGVKIRRDSGISLKPISRFASNRIVRFAFEYALKNNRKKVTAVHKANIMKFTDGLFLEEARKVAGDYQGKIIFEDAIVDNLAMQLVRRPKDYDVLVLPNLYGDIISDLCAGLVGGLGVVPGANIGERIALFEPVHGSAPKYAGQNKVNPTAMILSGVLMLRHIKEVDAAQRLERALKQVIREGKFVTYDLKEDRSDPTAVGTQQMADAIIGKLVSGDW